jgi:hypothetical protein
LTFWSQLEREFFTTPIWLVTTAIRGNMVWSDAGAIGWGGHVRLVSGEEHQARGYLTLAERAYSSTHRELIAILAVLESLERFIGGTYVRMYTDSLSGWRIITTGSGREHLHRLALAVFWFCVRCHIRLDLTWIPRGDNTQADYLAGIYDRDDWRLSDFWRDFLEDRWGPHTIDRFATDLNRLFSRFNSRWWCPGCENTDCLTLSDWASENNWCNPPFGLIGRLLYVLRAQRARTTIILPEWTGRHWWPVLCPDGEHFAPFVVDSVELPTTSIEGVELFLPGAGRANQVGVGPPAFKVWACRVDFTVVS